MDLLKEFKQYVDDADAQIAITLQAQQGLDNDLRFYMHLSIFLESQKGPVLSTANDDEIGLDRYDIDVMAFLAALSSTSCNNLL